MNSKLVLEYGVRYSVMMPYHALWGNQAFFSEKDYDPNLAPTVNPVTGFISWRRSSERRRHSWQRVSEHGQGARSRQHPQRRLRAAVPRL